MNIIEMARQAGGIDITNKIAGNFTAWIGTGTPEFLERFANLVAQHEREACCVIVYGQCESDNVAQRTVDAIRARGQQTTEGEQHEH